MRSAPPARSVTAPVFAAFAALMFVVGCGSKPSGFQGDPSAGNGGDNEADSGFLNSGPTEDGSSGNTDPVGSDGGTDRGEGGPSTTYPAFTPMMPQVIDNGGSVISNPNFVTVVWPSLDSSYSTWEAFDDGLGTSEYWNQTTSEYGMAQGSGGTHVELSTGPSFSSMSDVEDFVGQNAAVNWPPYPLSPSTFYFLYLPSGVSFKLQGIGDACSNGVGGYHDQTTAYDGSNIIFAVIFQCAGLSTEDITSATSHEAVEGVTDPINSGTYYGLDDSQFLAWDIFQQQQNELADMCEDYIDADFIDSQLGQGVQRIWSNAAAAAGHAPCVPAESGAYFNVTPIAPESVSIDESSQGGPSHYPGLGYYIPVGSSKTFSIGFYSDAPAAPWDIVVWEGNPLTGQTANVEASVDASRGQNGSVSNITVKVNGQDSSGTNSNLITVESKVPGDEQVSLGGGVSLGVHSRWMPILISSQR